MDKLIKHHTVSNRENERIGKIKHCKDKINKINKLEAQMTLIMQMKQCEEIRKKERDELLVCVSKNKFLKNEIERLCAEVVVKTNELWDVRTIVK